MSLENIIANGTLMIDVSSLMVGQKDFFVLDLYGALKKHRKKVYIKKEPACKT